MTFMLKTAGMAFALTVVAGQAFAKAHDQGVADGDFPEQGTAAVVESIEGPGVSRNFNERQRGEVASTNQDENRVEPVEQPGQQNQEPD